MKILLDTNVLIAAFVTRGGCSELFERCIRQHQPVSSPFILAEFQDKLRVKFKYTENMITASSELLRSAVDIVSPEPLPETICRDRDDDNILAAALAGKVDCIVTGDKDLLVLREYQGIAILSPAEFWAFEADFVRLP